MFSLIRPFILCVLFNGWLLLQRLCAEFTSDLDFASPPPPRRLRPDLQTPFRVSPLAAVAISGWLVMPGPEDYSLEMPNYAGEYLVEISLAILRFSS